MSNRRGFIDVLSLISIAFFVTTLTVAVSQVFKTQNIFNKAADLPCGDRDQKSCGGCSPEKADGSSYRCVWSSTRGVCRESGTVCSTGGTTATTPPSTIVGNSYATCTGSNYAWCGGCGGFCIQVSGTTCSQEIQKKCGETSPTITCNASTFGAIALYSGVGDCRQCLNGTWVKYPTDGSACKITDLTIVPVYLQSEYNTAKLALVKTPTPTPTPSPTPKVTPTSAPSNLCSTMKCPANTTMTQISGATGLCYCAQGTVPPTPKPTPTKMPTITPKATIVAVASGGTAKPTPTPTTKATVFNPINTTIPRLVKDDTLKANGTQDYCEFDFECLSNNCVAFPDGIKHCMSPGITSGYIAQKVPTVTSTTVTQEPTIWQQITAVANGGTVKTTTPQQTQQSIVQKTATNVWNWLNTTTQQNTNGLSSQKANFILNEKPSNVSINTGVSGSEKTQKPRISIFSLLPTSLKTATRPTPERKYVYYSQKDPQWQDLVGEDITDKEGVPSIYYDGCGIVTGAMISGDNPRIYYEKMQKYFLDTYQRHYSYNDYGTAYVSHIEVLENVYGCTTIPISGSYAEKKEEIKKYTENGVPVWINAKIYGSAHHTEAIGVNNSNEIVFNDPYYGEGIAIPDEKIKETDHGWSFTAVVCNN